MQGLGRNFKSNDRSSVTRPDKDWSCKTGNRKTGLEDRSVMIVRVCGPGLLLYQIKKGRDGCHPEKECYVYSLRSDKKQISAKALPFFVPRKKKEGTKLKKKSFYFH